ncbi:MAG TPA: DNA topoisomerase IV subunit A, partial [Afifellaceae bacterium]|nr:DNA topoisomerase IV subunit A [Afifellaceae bacterium]
NIPPHNAAELCDAALHLIKYPKATYDKLLELVPGPDFPTGGIIVSTRAEIAEAYKTGRGAFRIRARWEKEDAGRGTWAAVVTEIPYQVQKSKLIETIAGLIEARKVPLVGDIRDESAVDIRFVIEPKSRTVDPDLMMEQLFKLCDLESRFAMNMNVLSQGVIPNVLPIRDVLLQWLEHRKIVLVRRKNYRLEKIANRLEVVDGFLIAFLNLDEVIRIIRYEDEPKAELMKVFKLTDNQAEAILNMRLRSLRKLEEMELKREQKELREEQADLQDLVMSEDRQWTFVAWEIGEVKKAYSKDTELGRRRTGFADAPEIDLEEFQQAMIEKEPVTIVLSQKGWIRSMRGHQTDTSGLQFKQGDSLKLAFPGYTTDKVILFSTGGKFYTLEVARLPGGRGHGEPVRIMVDMEKDQDVVTAFIHDPERRMLVASTAGNGFLVKEADVVANTRKGKQVLNVSGVDEAKVCVLAKGDHVAVVGKNRKMLIFPLEQLPEMGRGKGVRLQRYKDGEIADARVFSAEEGLSWSDSAGRVHTRTLAELADWVGERAQAGRMAPQGFPKTNRFGETGL